VIRTVVRTRLCVRIAAQSLGRRRQAVARLGGDQPISCGKVPV